MPSSDRSFRALAQAEPGVVVALLAALAPRLLPRAARVSPEAVDDPRVVAPAPVDADFAARVGETELLHVECQGYRDTTFPDRLFLYHLGFVLRYRPRRVRTVALWLTAPPKDQRREVITIGDVTVRVTSLVLPELPAATLLRTRRTACFAPGADAGTMTAEELCERTARAMGPRASYNQRHLAVIAAAMRGRYEEMVKAMDKAQMQPIVIEDLVKFGEDRGLEKGLAQGLEKGLAQGLEKGVKKGRLTMARESLMAVLDARGLTLEPAQRRKLLAETSADRLRALLGRAANARTAAELFAVPPPGAPLTR